jgi:drug/metabolite transporter (DMT)-like permease
MGWVVVALLLATAFLLSNYALQYGATRLAAGTTALIMLSEVVFASVSSVLLATPLDARTVLGGSLIVSAALLATLRWPRKA